MWIKIKEGETVNAVIDFSSIKTIVKHWTGQRSELCLGEGCPHCSARIPKRWRYQARLYASGSPVDWEFGEQPMIDLKALPHTETLVPITITRLGEERSTRYQISLSEAKPKGEAAEEQQLLPIVNKYTRGKYGNLVKH
jgi:hypothetical protein